MITSPVSLRDAWRDLGNPAGAKSLNNSVIRGRTCTPSGNMSLASLNKTVTGMPASIEQWYSGGLGTPPNPDQHGYIWQLSRTGSQNTFDTKTDAGYSRDITHGCGRRSDADVVTESRVIGYIPDSGSYRLQATVYGGSNPASNWGVDTPACIAIAASEDGWLQGHVKLFFKEYYYFNVPEPQTITKDFQGDPTHPFITTILYQEVHGPIHQPPGNSQPNNVYYTKWGDVTVRKL